MTNITLPNDWGLRPHQQPVWDYMTADGGRDKRACLVWHRRAGKDSVAINLMAYLSQMRVGLYYYFAPTQAQCRKIAWDNVDMQGRRPIDQAFPMAMRKRTSNQEMRLELLNGSIIQVLGSDNYNSVVGSNPCGMIFSEWSLADAQARAYFDPILGLNHGWSIYPYTPRGMNHGWSLYNMASGNPNWFCQRLTVNDTADEHGNPLITPEWIQRERDEGKSEMLIQQEYYCNFQRENEKSVFHIESVTAAMEREPLPDDPGAATIVGVDCARFGDDSSVIATRVGKDFKTVPLVTMEGRLDTIQLAARIQDHCLRYRPDQIFLDVTGQGAGVSDELRRRGIRHEPINFQGKDDKNEVYANIRCGMMARFATWCEEPDVSLYDDAQLRMEMSVVDYHDEPDPHGRLKIIEKSKIKTLLEGHSPDKLDACMLTFARPVMRRDVRNFMRRNGDHRQAKRWKRGA